MEERRLSQSAMDLIYLAGCAVNSQPPRPERVAQIGQSEKGWEELRAKAQQQKMSAMTAIALESMSEEDQARVIPKEEREFWHKERMANLRRRMMFDAEREEIYHFLDSQGIWYVPLKGIIIQDYYPVYEMREMSDNDILFDESRREDVRKWFEERGYRLHAVENEDAYLKEPCYNFEMHYALYPNDYRNDFKNYFTDISRRLEAYDNKAYERRMSLEDFYLHFITHAYRHKMISGTGLRPICDLYVINRHLKADLNQEKTEADCLALGIDSFEKSLNNTAELLLRDPENVDWDHIPKDSLEIVFHMSTVYLYGSKKRWQENMFERAFEDEELNEETKWKYIRFRLFPSFDYMKDAFPILKKMPFLLPIMYPVRLILRALDSRSFIRQEVKELKKRKSE